MTPRDAVRNYAVKCVEDVLRVDQSINIEFAEIFRHCDPSLSQLWRVNLQTRADVFEYTVDHSRDGFFLVRAHSADDIGQWSNQMPPEIVRFRETPDHVLGYLWIFPVQTSQIFHNLFDVSFVELLEDQVADVLLHWRADLALDFRAIFCRFEGFEC